MKIIQFFLLCLCVIQRATCTEFNNENIAQEYSGKPATNSAETHDQGLQKKYQKPHQNQWNYNSPPRLRKKNQGSLDHSKILIPQLNPEASEYVPPKWLKIINIGLNPNANHVKLFDKLGNEATLDFDGDKAWTLHWNTLNHNGYADGQLEFCFKGKLNIQNHEIRNAEVKFEYVAFEFHAKHEVKEFIIDLKGCKKSKTKPYQTPLNAFNMNWIFAAETLTLGDNTYVKKIRGQIKTKIPTYKEPKSEFGNERKFKKNIPFMMMISEFNAVENLLSLLNVDECDLKPAEMKKYLKKYGFPGENINHNWKRKQLKKKLEPILQEKRESLFDNLKFPMKLDVIDEFVQIKIENLYLCANGSLVYAPNAGEKTIFDIDHAFVLVMFQKHDYQISSICENKITYSLEDSESTKHSEIEMSLVFSYEKIREVNIPYSLCMCFGDVNVVAGEPEIALFVRKKGEKGKWHEQESNVLFEIKKVWTQEDRQKTYDRWKLSF